MSLAWVLLFWKKYPVTCSLFLLDNQDSYPHCIHRDELHIPAQHLHKFDRDEEIFGPILPVIEYENLDEALAIINSRPKPLALYIFSRNKDIQQTILQATSSGGVCINDTVMQVGINELPFGGVGDSGIGSYHGVASFNTFSHHKSVLKKSFLFELNWRYAPYKEKVEQFKKMFTS